MRRVATTLIMIAVTALGACGVDDPPATGPHGHGPEAEDITSVAPPDHASVAEVVAWLDGELAARTPGSDLSITFDDLQTGEHVALRGDTKHVSASSAKAWWVAAALDTTNIAAVMPYATPIFANSDNSAAGSAIDLVGPDAMNTWMWNIAGMNDSALTQWNFDKTRVASNSPRAMGSDNYMTSDDASRFLTRVARKEILVDNRGDKLMEWMTLSPNSGLGGWIPDRLPGDVAMTAMHKAGWLPPGCCSDDSVYNTTNDIGIVETPLGRSYAIAILARRGTDYAAQEDFMALASCMIYRAFIQDDELACE